MNTRFMIICALLFLAIAICPLDAGATNKYVRDWITITIRTSPYDNARITAMANSGDSFKILEDRGEWTKVESPSGKKGWVHGRYLTKKTPKAVIAKSLEKKVDRLSEKTNKLEEENNALKKQNRAYNKEIGSVSRELNASKKRYTDLKKASSEYLEMKKAHEQLTEKDKASSLRMETLIQENKRMETSRNLRFTLIGGGFILIGLALGIFLQFLVAKPRKSSYKF
ncbi:MAG: TIGR04211 family SH3 domain-containing protein [Thermodesulfobacteriota bacterium]|nr:TIGR04211 family SH3 domain-containing protein [Thermodesulfobacteriota bacterium]